MIFHDCNAIVFKTMNSRFLLWINWGNSVVSVFDKILIKLPNTN